MIFFSIIVLNYAFITAFNLGFNAFLFQFVMAFSYFLMGWKAGRKYEKELDGKADE